jgi:lipid A 3-O-deacylase
MMLRFFTKFLASTAFLILFPTVVVAAEKDTSPKELGTFEVKFENDLFSGVDQHYTNGIRVSWLSPEGDTIAPLQYVRDLLEELAQDTNKSTRFGLSAGQDLYTPRDRYRTDLITEDRPYAGWLYGGLSLHTVTDRGGERKDLESIELDVGLVGPYALGEQTQNFVHEVRLIDTFDGWDNQLKNEIGLALHYERKWRLFDPVNLAGPIEFDAIPHAGVSVGNVVTQAIAGGALRWGWNLPHNFGPPSVIQGGTSVDRFPEKSISAYLFASGQGRYVAHNIFLDGNTFRNSHDVDRTPLVGDVSLGAAILLGRFKLSYANAFRSKEFDSQSQISRFGSITASFQAAF